MSNKLYRVIRYEWNIELHSVIENTSQIQSVQYHLNKLFLNDPKHVYCSMFNTSPFLNIKITAQVRITQHIHKCIVTTPDNTIYRILCPTNTLYINHAATEWTDLNYHHKPHAPPQAVSKQEMPCIRFFCFVVV